MPKILWLCSKYLVNYAGYWTQGVKYPPRGQSHEGGFFTTFFQYPLQTHGSAKKGSGGAHEELDGRFRKTAWRSIQLNSNSFGYKQSTQCVSLQTESNGFFCRNFVEVGHPISEWPVNSGFDIIHGKRALVVSDSLTGSVEDILRRRLLIPSKWLVFHCRSIIWSSAAIFIPCIAEISCASFEKDNEPMMSRGCSIHVFRHADLTEFFGGAGSERPMPLPPAFHVLYTFQQEKPGSITFLKVAVGLPSVELLMAHSFSIKHLSFWE